MQLITVKKYEEVFYKLLGDESLPLLDILTPMRCIERDVILVHGINDINTSIGINRIIHQIHDFLCLKKVIKNTTKTKF